MVDVSRVALGPCAWPVAASPLLEPGNYTPPALRPRPSTSMPILHRLWAMATLCSPCLECVRPRAPPHACTRPTHKVAQDGREQQRHARARRLAPVGGQPCGAAKAAHERVAAEVSPHWAQMSPTEASSKAPGHLQVMGDWGRTGVERGGGGGGAAGGAEGGDSPCRTCPKPVDVLNVQTRAQRAPRDLARPPWPGPRASRLGRSGPTDGTSQLRSGTTRRSRPKPCANEGGVL